MEIKEQFEALVKEGVVEALSPYRDAILAMAELVRSAAPAATEKRPAARKKEAAEPRVVKGAVEASKQFSVGQKVRYRQGRGEFEATVEVNDQNAGELVLNRVSDGKIVRRPATKVTAA